MHIKYSHIHAKMSVGKVDSHWISGGTTVEVKAYDIRMFMMIEVG